MKEFIDKLISRLEEKKCEYKKLCDACDIDSELQYDLGRYYGVDDAISIVNQLAEEYKGGWIPCSEKMPEDEKYVWVILGTTYESNNTFYGVARYLRFDDGEQHWCESHYGYLEWDAYSDEQGGCSLYNVIAWKPIEPYQKEGKQV